MVHPLFRITLLYVSYLYFGAIVFYMVEPQLERTTWELKMRERIEVSSLLSKHLAPQNPNLQRYIIEKTSQYCGVPVSVPDCSDQVNYLWTFYHCLFFAMTIVTTVGYGNMYPTSTFGRVFVMLFATMGMPMNGILFSRFGQMYWDWVETLHNRLSSLKKLHIFAKWFLFVVPGFVLFVILPSFVFTHFETWDYEISVYYAFVTLTTIGFGDFAATFTRARPGDEGYWYDIYKVFFLVWFFLGLGYVVMINDYLSRKYERTKIRHLHFEQPSKSKEVLREFMRSSKKDASTIVGVMRRPFEWRQREQMERRPTIRRTNSSPNLTNIF